jgi:hypothetical protein
MEIEDWEITCKADEFEKMREKPEFIAIVRLARILNAFRTVHVTMADSTDDGSPAYDRLRTNTLLLTGAILHEGIESIKDNQKAYRDLDAYEKLQKDLLKTKRYALIKNYIKDMRNKIVFHYDKEVFETTLLRYKRDKYVFARGQGPSKRNLNYSMADTLCLNYLFDVRTTEILGDKEIGEIIQEVMRFGMAFADIADLMIVEALSKMGWEPKEKGTD